MSRNFSHISFFTSIHHQRILLLKRKCKGDGRFTTPLSDEGLKYFEYTERTVVQISKISNVIQNVLQQFLTIIIRPRLDQSSHSHPNAHSFQTQYMLTPHRNSVIFHRECPIEILVSFLLHQWKNFQKINYLINISSGHLFSLFHSKLNLFANIFNICLVSR